MSSSLFEWDEDKAKRNFDKHGVNFEEGVTVFGDLLVATMPDPDHSEDEYRWIAIGESVRGRVLVVSFTERRNSIRIISCRRAAPKERVNYEEGRF